MVPPARTAILLRIPVFRTVILILLFSVAIPSGAAQSLACTPASLDFGKVAVGQQKTLSATLSNTGSAAVDLTSLQVGNSAFTATGLQLPLTLQAGQKVAFNVVFAPASAHYEQSELVFSSSSGSSTGVPVSGQAVNDWALAASPSSLAFGNVAIGSNSTLPVTLTNQGSSTITISRELAPPQEYTVKGPALPITLGAGQTATFNITFTPKWRGLMDSQFAVSNLADPVLTVPLSGTGGGTGSALLTVKPSTLSFGSVTVGKTGTQAGTVTATGGNVTITSASLGSSLFSLNGITLPLTLAAGQSASFDVVFTPQAGGNVTSALSFASSAGGSPTAEALSGNGVEPVYTVDLSWNPSTSQVSGYNVYRSPSSTGTFSKINPTLDPGTAFTDSTVASGATYYYDVRSVDSSGVESSPCKPVKVTVN